MSAPIGRVGEFRINGTPYPVYANMNTLAKYAQLSDGDDIFSLVSRIDTERDTLLKMNPPKGSTDEAIAEANGKQTLHLLGSIGMSSIQRIGAAALHKYDSANEPQWPFTPGQLGGMIELQEWFVLVPLLLQGLTNFMPNKEDIPAHAAEAAKNKPDPTPAESQPVNGAPAGGPPSTPSDAAVLDSLTTSSGDLLSEGSA